MAPNNIFCHFLTFFLITGICIMLVLHLMLLIHQPASTFFHRIDSDLPHFAEIADFIDDSLQDLELNNNPNKKLEDDQSESHKTDMRKDCAMNNCFNFNLCKQSFKVYVYPDFSDDYQSDTFRMILRSIRSSVYFTSDPNEACLFIPSVDTLDRDVNSANFNKELSKRITSLKYWNNTGRNHLTFNLYAGTSPDYYEDYYFKVSECMLAKASSSIQNFRQNFDISFPLMHTGYRFHSSRPKPVSHMLNDVNKKYTLAFKGKRYLVGIGSRNRNALFHLHNNKDIILLTTCRHRDWTKYVDHRCLIDNRLYDRYDYDELLKVSTFCLVPRGRRLGSYRFLEVLRAGCIPVILSNDYELPFSEVINWRKAVIWVDERLLFQLPWIVRSVSQKQIIAYRQQVKFLYDTYFSSLDKIINTVLEIIKDRVSIHSRDKFIWNNFPGALALRSGYSSYICHFPVSIPSCKDIGRNAVTIIIYANKFMNCSEDFIIQTIFDIKSSDLVKKIIIVWQDSADKLLRLRNLLNKGSLLSGFLTIIEDESQSPNARFSYLSEISTMAIITLKCHVAINHIQVKQLYQGWINFPDRIIGYISKSLKWNPVDARWKFLNRAKEYSIVLLDVAIYHRYFQWSYWQVLSPQSRELVDNSAGINHCDSILFNMLVSHSVHKSPFIITQRNVTDPKYKLKLYGSFSHKDESCLNEFVTLMGYLPLEKTKIVLDV